MSYIRIPIMAPHEHGGASGDKIIDDLLSGTSLIPDNDRREIWCIVHWG